VYPIFLEGFGGEFVGDVVVGREPTDLARVVDSPEFGHLHALVEPLARIIQETVLQSSAGSSWP
jgi:hypothetical protein